MSAEEVASIRQCIKESLHILENYKTYLSSELINVGLTKEGVKCSIAKAKKDVNDKFEVIEEELLKALRSRKNGILQAINDVANKDLEPLNNLEEKINGQLEQVEKLKEQGNEILEREDADIVQDSEQTLKELSIQQNRYPNMPCISQTLTVTFEDNYIECVNHIGEISMTGSLQIVTLTEQPGGMLVEWDDTFSDSESVTEYSGVQEYILQSCCTDNKGNNDSAVFNTVYNGEGMSHVVSDLEPHVSYTFRVCGRFGRDGRWSSWSIPRSGMTTLDPHEWSAEDCLNSNQLAIYQLSNKKRTATKVFPDSSKVLRSKTMSYRVDTALQFKIDETGDDSNGDGLGLTTSSFDFTNQNLQCPGSVSINSKGLVYVNGNSMTTQMPAFKRGTVISFEVNHLNPGKLRVSISVDDKQVTFDWAIEEKDDCSKLYFAMGFQHSGWQITV